MITRKVEYLVDEIIAPIMSKQDLKRYLNDLGTQGWRMCAGDITASVYIFSRELPEEANISV